MRAKGGYLGGVTIVVLLLVTSLLTSGATAAVSGPGGTTGSVFASSQTVHATSSISVWDRAGLPLRTEKSNAAHRVTLGSTFVNIESQSTGNIPANLGQAAVFSKGSKLTLQMSSNVLGADPNSYANDSAQLVIARLTPKGKAHTFSSSPTTLGGVKQLLNGSSANRNASFSLKNNITLNSQGGATITTPTLHHAGTYLFLLATSSDGHALSATHGNISVGEPATVIGVDSAILQDSSSSVSGPGTVHPGQNATFTVTTPPGSAPVNQSVLIYKKKTFENSRTTLSVSGQINQNMSAKNLTLRDSIGTVNGVARFNGPITILNSTIHSKDKSGRYTAQQVYNYATLGLKNRTGLNASGATVVPGSTVLPASIVGHANAGRSDTINVPTFRNWSTGKYVWVAMSGNKNGLYTNTGTFSLTKRSYGGGGGGGSGGGGSLPSSGSNPGNPIITPSNNGQQQKVSIGFVSAGQSVNLNFNPTAEAVTKTGFAMNSMNMSFSGNSNSFDLTVQPVSKPSSSSTGGATSSASGSTPLGYFQINHQQSEKNIGSVTFSFSVSASKLQAAGTSPNHVILYRDHRGAWHSLSTTPVSESNGIYTFQATSPGLSLYEIGTSPAHFAVSNPNASTISPKVGQSVSFSANVTNTGGTKNTTSIPLMINGQTVGTQTITLAPNQSTLVSFSHTFSKAGDYSIQIGNQSIGSIHVASTGESTSTTTTTITTGSSTSTGTTSGTSTTSSTSGSTPGFGLGIVIVALAAAALLTLRRR